MKENEETENPTTETTDNRLLNTQISYSASAEGFVWTGWIYYWLGVNSYEQLYY